MCDGHLRASVAGRDERRAEVRLLGWLATAPFLLSAAVAGTVAPALGPQAALALVATTFLLFWSGAAIVSRGGRLGLDRAGMLAAGGLSALVVAGAGGLSSPAALLLPALAFEAWWVGRRKRDLLWGAGVATAAMLAQSALAGHFAGATANTAHWLLPLAWLASVAPRVASLVLQAPGSDERPATLEEAIDAVVLRMNAVGEVARVSGRARELLGLAPEFLHMNGFFERIHVADRVGYLCALADMRRGDDRRHVELRLRLPAIPQDAAPAYRNFALEMIRRGEGAEGLIAVLRSNEEVAALRKRLASVSDHAEGLEIAKSRFLAAVSHELRTPLNAIIGFSDMLLNDMAGPLNDPRQKEYVGLVRDSGHHLLSVVNAILDVSRIEAGVYTADPESFPFREALDLCRAMLSQQAGDKQVALVLDVPSDPGEIHADRRAVRQILINLVGNAIKFTPTGGTVVVGCRRGDTHLEFWVRDNGIGMSQDDLARVGRPFTQVQNDYTRQFEGAGLGLSLVKGLVGLHKGSMVIESEPGMGTTVTVALPLAGSVATLPLAAGDRDDGAGRYEGKADGALRKAG